MTEARPGRGRFALLVYGAALFGALALYAPLAGAPGLPGERERAAVLASGTPAAALAFRESPDDSKPLAGLVRHWLLQGAGSLKGVRILAAALHGLSAGLIFALGVVLIRAGTEPGGASLLAPAAGACLFLVQPICAEAIMSFGGLPLVLATSLALLSILLAAKASGAGETPRPFAVAAVFLGALLCDPSVWPAGLVAAALSSRPAAAGAPEPPPGPAFRRALWPYLLAMALCYASWSARNWPALGLLPVEWPRGLLAGVASQSAAFVTELRLLVMPWTLSVDHGHVAYAGGWGPQAILGAALLAGLAAAALLAGARGTLLGAGLAWYAGMHAHFLAAPPAEPVTERRLYACMAAAALAAAAVVRGLERRYGAAPAFALAGLLTLPLVPPAAQRARLWQDPIMLWSAAAEVNPASPRTHLTLAGLHLARGDDEAALRSYEAARERAPRNAEIQVGIAEVYFRRRDYGRAIQEAVKAAEADPLFFPAYITAGNSYLMRNQTREAFLSYNSALRLRPEDPTALYNMGSLQFGQNRFQTAAKLLEAAAKGRPRDPEILFRLGMSRLNSGDSHGAVEALRGCLAEDPGRIDAQVNLAAVLTQLRHFEEARLHLNAVLEKDPRHGKALNGLAILASAEGRWEEARDFFERAVASDPDNLRTLYNLAGAYEKVGAPAKAAESYREFLARWTGDIGVGEDARARLARLETAPAR